MPVFFLAAWRAISGAAGAFWRALETSKPLRWAVGGLVALFLVVFGVRRAVKKAKAAGAEEREDQIFDRIEKDTKHAIEKIEEAGRDLSEEIGPPAVFEDTSDGRGLSSDDLNSRELERLRKRAADDPRNRRNPREDPRG